MPTETQRAWIDDRGKGGTRVERIEGEVRTGSGAGVGLLGEKKGPTLLGEARRKA